MALPTARPEEADRGEHCTVVQCSGGTLARAGLRPVAASLECLDTTGARPILAIATLVHGLTLPVT